MSGVREEKVNVAPVTQCLSIEHRDIMRTWPNGHVREQSNDSKVVRWHLCAAL